MEHGADSQVTPTRVYDVVLAGRPPDWLRSRFPTMSVRGTRPHTALRRRVSGPAQLDDLLEKLCSLGLHLLEVHRLSGATAEHQTYEVLVDGEVGEPVLRYLRWSHRVVSGQIRVRIAEATSELQDFLDACSEIGADVQRVRLVTPARARQVA